MARPRRIALIAAVVFLGGCSSLQGFTLRPYRMNIQQGNYLEAEAVDQLEIGMTQSQVRFLVGTPMIADPFNADRWDYVFFFQVGRTRNEVKSQLTVWFEDGRVVRIDRPEDIETDEQATDFDA